MAAIRPPALLPFPQGNSPVPRPIPSSVMALTLVANTAQSFTLPSVTGGSSPGARFVIFSCTANFYANCYATATVPSTVTDGTASELSPTAYMLTPGEPVTISVISPSACVITASFYA